MNKLATLTLLCLLPCAAQAGRPLTPEEYDRLTATEAPYRMDCPYDATNGWYDCPALPQAAAAPQRDDYLPPVMPENDEDGGIAKPTFVRLMQMMTASCRKAGKNSEFCVESERYGADDYQAGLFQ